MSAPHVRRQDIALEGEVEHEAGFVHIESRSHYYCIADLTGRLSTGENVSLRRQGDTHAEALANLESAILENGWEIR